MLFLYILAAVIAQYMKVTWHTTDSLSGMQCGGKYVTEPVQPDTATKLLQKIVSFKNKQQLCDEPMLVRVYAGSHQIYIH